MNIFEIIILVSAVLLTVMILVQSSGASLGAGFGGTSEIYTTKRGVDKTMHQITIILAFVFIISIMLNLL